MKLNNYFRFGQSLTVVPTPELKVNVCSIVLFIPLNTFKIMASLEKYNQM